MKINTRIFYVIMMKSADPYHFFSKIYDSVMEHVNFYQWAEFIWGSITPIKPDSILDLGCGTGSLLKAMPEVYRKVGLDNSDSMLSFARKNCKEAEFVKGQIQNFNLKEKFDLIVCTHDTINYLLEERELKEHFLNVYNHLDDSGHYFFDISSEYNLINNFDKKTFRGEYENIYFLWENKYDSVEKLIYSYLRFTLASGKNLESIREIHKQRYYSPELVENLLSKVGFKVIQKGGDYKTKKVHPKSSLLTYLVRKKG